MTGEVFLDTNLLLYACSSAPEDATKRRIAEDLMLDGSFALSAQVLQEFIANALRKPRLGISEGNIDATLQLASLVRVQAITRELVLSAVALRRRYPLSQWDATILAAAKELGCEVVYSEDMNHGQDYGGVRVINPFRESNPGGQVTS
jgi:predicted nucleic acid-binding protein